MHAKYSIVNESSDLLVIRDEGGELCCLTVTNDAEWVIEDLIKRGLLAAEGGQRLLYYDSAGCLDELLVKDGKFAGFKPYQRRQ